MFKFFRAPKLEGLSFLDWANRVVLTLRDSLSEVQKSNMEDTFENVLGVFSDKAYDLLNGFEKVKLHVNKHGIFALNEYTKEEVFVLQFNTRGKIAGLPISSDFSKVSANNHILKLLVESYDHRLAKLESQRKRLEEELFQVERSRYKVMGYLDALSGKKTETTGVLVEFDKSGSMKTTPSNAKILSETKELAASISKPAAPKKKTTSTKKKSSK
jgi:hypothetical protein